MRRLLLLIDMAGVDVNLQHAGTTALLEAAAAGLGKALGALLDRGADIESRDGSEFSPLHTACIGSHLECISLLLDRGAHLESVNIYGLSPLNTTAFSGHREVASLLIERGADIESRDTFGRSPLNNAATAGHREVVTLLLDKGVDIESKDSNGRSPLTNAAFFGRLDVIALLLDSGADLNSRDAAGRSALNIAASSGGDHAQEIITLLLDRGAEIKSTDRADDYSPISRESRRGRPEVGKALALLSQRDTSTISTAQATEPGEHRKGNSSDRGSQGAAQDELSGAAPLVAAAEPAAARVLEVGGSGAGPAEQEQGGKSHKTFLQHVAPLFVAGVFGVLVSCGIGRRRKSLGRA
jgi:ankyrin repeat protein